MAIKHFQIELDKSSHTYYAGETMNGVVTLVLDAPKKIRGVSLQFKGVAEVKWTERRGAGKNRRVIHFHGRTDYMNHTTYITGSSDGESFHLPAGTHIYNFSCALPANLATSVEAKRGYIRYTIKVTLNRAWMLDKSYKMGFTVLQLLDLNVLSNVRLPIKMDVTKTFCCWPCRTGPLHMSAQLPISGYVPGQTIVVMVTVDNRSERILGKIVTRLVQHTTYVSKTPHQETIKESSEIVQAESAASNETEKSCYEHHLFIPPLTPTNISCEVLQITYRVEIKTTNSFGWSPTVKIPITLGTIPLVSSAIPRFEEVTLPADQQCKPGASGEDPECNTNYPIELPPPTYEEVMNAHRVNIQDEDEKNEIGCEDFSPRYLIYRFPPVPCAPPAESEVSRKQSA
ncbi:arrestin domain-containing protein 3-like [Sabethes cyaneus]|uniref:arrestin domain-containing protein 3-like n=1 Tax=Sabethes cyaneus TaxID=53552 RepID=UPI00237E72A0|nr:arrestin domain-containing protein 3-like [Sabethes cyaneus]